MPPKGWREDYAASAEIAGEALSTLLPRKIEADGNLSDVEEAVTSLLSVMATLAYRYDAQPRTPTGAALYAANVMVFIPIAAQSPYLAADVQESLRFFPAESDPGQLDGVLKLVPQLTFSTATDGLDETVPGIALPVPRVPKAASGRWRVLPGAPLAFVGEGVDGYADVSTLRAWFDESADFPGSVRDEVVDYFAGPGAASRSFVSRRLRWGGEKLGVLNLHANLPNLLGVSDHHASQEASVERRAEFFALMTPLLRDLEGAVKLYREMGGS